MKTEIYGALAIMNQATEQITESIEKLRDAGLLTPHFAEIRILAAQENCLETSVSAIHKLTAVEEEDAHRVQQERTEKEARLKES